MIADTCVLVDLIRNDRAARQAVTRIEAEGGVLWVPTPAAFELWEGVERADRPHEEQLHVQRVLEAYTVLPFSAAHAERAGRLSGELARRGRMLEPVDVQIAGIALAEGQPVLTRNKKDFERVPGLKIVAY